MRIPADLIKNIVLNFYSNNNFYSKGLLEKKNFNKSS